MREIKAQEIASLVARLCVEANRTLSPDLEQCLRHAACTETNGLAQGILDDICNNLDAARELKLPIRQDTGMAVVFVDIGQDVHLIGDTLENAVNQGVREGYVEGLLRCSVVADPLRRTNTGDNTPAILHTRLVPGDQVHIMVAPKGFGSENMSKTKIFTPSAAREDIIAFIVDAVQQAGSNPCPPVVVGVGIGGDFEYSAILAKRALCRSVSQHNQDPFYAEMEKDCLAAINRTGIGPQGFGGDTTALAVNIEQFATHIAGLPVAVNMGCHVTRHRSGVL